MEIKTPAARQHLRHSQQISIKNATDLGGKMFAKRTHRLAWQFKQKFLAQQGAGARIARLSTFI
jgi:hypothetical protein